MTTLRRTVGVVIATAVVVVGIVLLLHGHTGSATPAPRRSRPGTSTVAVTPQQAAITRAQDAFVDRYLAYLDGTGTVTALPFASITAREQAGRGGRIPAAFRDGALRVTRASGENTDYSAQATITAANRSESYVLTVQLLLTQHGWQVAQVSTPDLAMDDDIRPVLGPAVPTGGRLASRLFALGYTAYRTGRSVAIPVRLTATAQSELEEEQDPLAGVARSEAQPRLLGLRFGPLERNEFAVTATVRAGGQRRQFTVLMVKHAGRWECDAFL
jgi:hypothetical protein